MDRGCDRNMVAGGRENHAPCQGGRVCPHHRSWLPEDLAWVVWRLGLGVLLRSDAPRPAGRRCCSPEFSSRSGMPNRTGFRKLSFLGRKLFRPFEGQDRLARGVQACSFYRYSYPYGQRYGYRIRFLQRKEQ